MFLAGNWGSADRDGGFLSYARTHARTHSRVFFQPSSAVCVDGEQKIRAGSTQTVGTHTE